MALVEVSLDDIPVAGKDWGLRPTTRPAIQIRQPVRGITVSYPSIQHNPPAPDARPKRPILKQGASNDAAKSRKRVKFNNRGRPAGVRDKTSKNLEEAVATATPTASEIVPEHPKISNRSSTK